MAAGSCFSEYLDDIKLSLKIPVMMGSRKAAVLPPEIREMRLKIYRTCNFSLWSSTKFCINICHCPNAQSKLTSCLSASHHIASFVENRDGVSLNGRRLHISSTLHIFTRLVVQAGLEEKS